MPHKHLREPTQVDRIKNMQDQDKKIEMNKVNLIPSILKSFSETIQICLFPKRVTMKSILSKCSPAWTSAMNLLKWVVREAKSSTGRKKIIERMDLVMRSKKVMKRLRLISFTVKLYDNTSVREWSDMLGNME